MSTGHQHVMNAKIIDGKAVWWEMILLPVSM